MDFCGCDPAYSVRSPPSSFSNFPIQRTKFQIIESVQFYKHTQCIYLHPSCQSVYISMGFLMTLMLQWVSSWMNHMWVVLILQLEGFDDFTLASSWERYGNGIFSLVFITIYMISLPLLTAVKFELLVPVVLVCLEWRKPLNMLCFLMLLDLYLK